jgi:DNA-binding MarR family transcriptional regulator
MGELAGERGTGPDVAPSSVAFLVSRLGYEVTGKLTRGLAPLGIEPRDFGLLRALARAEGASQRSAGRSLNVPPSRMVALVDGLERRGLVQRRAHPSDRRAHALFLTAAGRLLLGRALEVAAEVESGLCADLAPGERDALLGLLGKLSRAGALPAASAPGAASQQPPDDDHEDGDEPPRHPPVALPVPSGHGGPGGHAQQQHGPEHDQDRRRGW